jgi:hypothetical protein
MGFADDTLCIGEEEGEGVQVTPVAGLDSLAAGS